MIDIADLQQEIDRLAASVEAFGPASDQAERGRLRAQLRRVLEQLQRLDETATERAARSADGRVESTIGDEEAAAKTLILRVLGLRRYLTGTSGLDDPEAHELLEKAIDIAASYQSLDHHQLIEATAGGWTAAEKPLARPGPKTTDYAELSREHMVRYPKIRAALAK